MDWTYKIRTFKTRACKNTHTLYICALSERADAHSQDRIKWKSSYPSHIGLFPKVIHPKFFQISHGKSKRSQYGEAIFCSRASTSGFTLHATRAVMLSAGGLSIDEAKKMNCADLCASLHAGSGKAERMAD